MAETSRRGAWTGSFTPFGGRKIEQGPQGGSFFPHAQPLRRRVGFRQSSPAADVPGLGVFALGLLLGNRRETGQVVQVGDDAGQHPEHSGTVERDVLAVGIGLRAAGSPRPSPRDPSRSRPLAALAEGVQSRPQGVPGGRRGPWRRGPPPDHAARLSHWGISRDSIRAQELVDPIRANPCGGRDVTDRQRPTHGLRRRPRSAPTGHRLVTLGVSRDSRPREPALR